MKIRHGGRSSPTGRGDRGIGSQTTKQLVTTASLTAGRLSRNADKALARANRVDAPFDKYSKGELDRLRRLCVLCGKTATYYADSKTFCYRHREEAMRAMKAYGEKKYGKQ